MDRGPLGALLISSVTWGFPVCKLPSVEGRNRSDIETFSTRLSATAPLSSRTPHFS